MFYGYLNMTALCYSQLSVITFNIIFAHLTAQLLNAV